MNSNEGQDGILSARIVEGTETIVLERDTEDNIKIKSGQNVTLDLAGHKLSGARPRGQETLFVEGTLHIIDSVGGGVIDGVSQYKSAIRTRIGSTLTIDGGTITRSVDDGVASNSWYTIWNEGGRLVIGEGANVVSTSKTVPAILVGFLDSAGNPKEVITQAFINGGTITGNRQGVLVEKYGNLRISKGEITANGEAVYNTNKTEILGGKLWSNKDFAVCNQAGETNAELGLVTIDGGMFKGKKGDLRLLSEYIDTARYIVRGGEFSVRPPEEYLASGMTVEQTPSGTWIVSNGDKPPVSYEGGAAGSGFFGFRRFIIQDDLFVYKKGGMSLPNLRDFDPIAVIANGVGGIDAYFDREVKKLFLYRNGTEFEGEIKDMTLIFIGI